MSIGFSVFQTSGAKEASSAPSANVTANTTSAPQNSRRRTGSSAAARAARAAAAPRPRPPAARRASAAAAPTQQRRRRRAARARRRSAARRRARCRSDAAIHISHVTSSRPSSFAKPEPGAGQPAEHERSQRRGRQADHLDQRRRARAPSSMRGRGGYRASAMALYERDRRPAAEDRGLRARAPRPDGVLRLRARARPSIAPARAAARTGRGEDVTYEAEAQDAQHAAGPVLDARRRVDVRLVLRAPRRRSTSSRATRPSRPVYRTTAAGASSRRRSTSRCARPGTSLHASARPRAAAGARSSSPRGWASRRRSTRSRAGSRATRAALQARRRRRTGPTS